MLIKLNACDIIFLEDKLLTVKLTDKKSQKGEICMAQYLKQDSELGYIVDNADIEYSKFNNLRHVVLGCMLGDFDETGAYVVDKEIVQELISMPKHIVESMDNIEICQGELKLDKYISFMVTFEGNKATLSLIEKLNYEANFKLDSGIYSNIVETVLDEVETSGEINRNVLYTRWNIGSFGGNVIDIFSCDNSVLEKYFGIVNRFKYLLESNRILLDKEEELEEIEAEYANEMFEILKRYPKLEKEVVAQIKENLKNRKDALSINKPNFAKTFNEILDNAIQANIDKLDDKEKESFKTEQHNVVNNTNIKKQEVLDIEIVKNENTPNSIKIKTDSTETLKSVTELGTIFLDSNKKVVERLNQNTKQQETNNKNKLLKALNGIGVKAFIVGIPKVDAQNLVPEPVNNLVKAVVETKKVAKKAQVVSVVVKNPVTKKKKTTNNAINKTQNNKTTTTEKQSQKRYVSSLIAQKSEEGLDDEVVADTLSNEGILAIEQKLALKTVTNKDDTKAINKDLKNNPTKTQSNKLVNTTKADTEIISNSL